MKVFRSARLMLFAFLLCLVPASSFAGVFISINIAPPVLPVYEQPPCPEDGYIWTPGYWAYGEDGYYWVPGAWVPAPQYGYLWTPPYWGFEGGHYLFHAGYWGPHIGYYGGVNYGFGYMGIGFAGGEWRGNHFFYNTAVVNVNRTVIRNVYVNQTIVHNTTIINNNRVAYSGGPGGIQHQPTPQERIGMSERHIAPTPVQQQHFQAAASNPQLRFAANHGRPAITAAARPMVAPMHTQSAIRPGQNGQPNRPEMQARPAEQNRPALQTRPNTEMRPNAQPSLQNNQPRPNMQQSHPAPVERPNTQQYHPQAAPVQRPEARPVPQARPESRPAPQPRMESRPAPQPRMESRPAPQARPESRPAPRPSGEHPHGRSR